MVKTLHLLQKTTKIIAPHILFQRKVHIKDLNNIQTSWSTLS